MVAGGEKGKKCPLLAEGRDIGAHAKTISYFSLPPHPSPCGAKLLAVFFPHPKGGKAPFPWRYAGYGALIFKPPVAVRLLDWKTKTECTTFPYS